MHNLATPIKITMGKGFVMASRVGVIEFVFKDNGNRNVVVLLPAMVCEDFDTDLVILSGPMLNSVNIPLQAFTGDRAARAPELHPFGEPCVMIQQLDKRPNKLADTSGLGY